MKKLLLGMFALSVLCVGCSEDDFGSLQLEQGTESSKFVAYNEREFQIPFSVEGKWTANIASEEDAWIRIPVTEGEGNYKLSVILDPNTSRERRSGKIIITNQRETITYTVNQGTLYEAAGDNSNINVAAFGENLVPLGYGIRIKKDGSNDDILATNMIMDIASWDALDPAVKEKTEMDGNFVSQTKVPASDIVFTTAEQYSNPKKDIEAHLSVTIGFGLNKIGLNGGFRMNNNRSDSTYCYRVATTVPSVKYRVKYNDYMSYAVAEEAKSIRSKVLGGEFLKRYNNLVSCFDSTGNVVNTTLLNKTVKNIEKDFGPVFCLSGTTGGSIDLEVLAKRESGTDSMSIDGDLQAGLNFGFEFNMSASARYLQTATSSLKQISVTAKFVGGSLAAQDSVLLATRQMITKPEDMQKNSDCLMSGLNCWRNSFKEFTDGTGMDGNVTLIDYTLAGIWQAFKHDNPEIEKAMQLELKKYIRSKYPNKKVTTKDENGKDVVTEVCPYLVDIQELTDDLVE